MKRGDTFVAYADRRPADRVYGVVTRVARDGSWADIRCCTWAVMWTKRQPTTVGDLPACTWQHWNQADLDIQEDDWEAKRREQAAP